MLSSLLVLLFASVSQTQAQDRRAPLKPKPQSAATKRTPVERVNFLVRIHSNKLVSISSVDTGLERNEIPVTDVEKGVRNELLIKMKRGLSVEPTILVMPDPTVDVATLVAVVRSLRISKATELKVDLPDGSSTLQVPQDPKFLNTKDVKPNPLTLIVELDSNGKLSLNTETQTDYASLTSFLTRIFKEREEMGVFRVGTNFIEKTVFLKIDGRMKVADLQKVAAAVQAGGAWPIGLRVDDLSR